MSVLHRLSDSKKETFLKNVYNLKKKELDKATLARKELTLNRQALVVAKVVFFVFSLAAIPSFFLNRGEKIGAPAVLLTAAAPLLIAVGRLFDCLYLSPALHKKRDEVDELTKLTEEAASNLLFYQQIKQQMKLALTPPEDVL